MDTVQPFFQNHPQNQTTVALKKKGQIVREDPNDQVA